MESLAVAFSESSLQPLHQVGLKANALSTTFRYHQREPLYELTKVI